MSARSTQAGENHLANFGYRQELDRSIGTFASFAAGVSYISILTGIFQLFYFGFGAGGPAYIWSWPMVFLGQLMVALCFAELAAQYLLAGSLYNWTKRLGSRTTSGMAGWMMLTASIMTLSATALAYQVTLPQLWSGFQLVGDGTGTYDVAVNAVVLGSALILFTTVVSAYGVRLMARVNSAGVLIELVAAVLIVVVLAAAMTRGPVEVLTATAGRGEDQSLGYLGAFLVAALASGYVMYGFDTASSLGEETVDPRRTAPRAIVRAVTASFVLGGLILLFGLMAVQDRTTRSCPRAPAACSTWCCRRRARAWAGCCSSASSSLSPSAAWPCTRRRSGWCSRWRGTTTCPSGRGWPRSTPGGRPRWSPPWSSASCRSPSC